MTLSVRRRRALRLLSLFLLLALLLPTGAEAASPDAFLRRGTGAGTFPPLPAATVTTPKSQPNPLSASAGTISVSREAGEGVELLRYTFPEVLRSAEFCMVTLSPGGSFVLDLGTETPYCFTADESGGEQPLDPAALPESPFFLRADGREWLLIRPQAYRDYDPDKGTLRLAGGGELSFFHDAAGWRLGVNFPGSEGFCSFWYLRAESLDREGGYGWYGDCTVGLFGDLHRLTARGYFYPTSSSHLDYAPDLYYRIPAPHIAVKLSHSPALPAQLCAVAMLDLCRAGASPDGYLPTRIGVDWLLADYGLGPGFYDTRFNTDFAWALLDLGNRLQIGEFQDQAARFAAFLSRHVAQHTDGTVYFSPDYGHAPGEEGAATHTSLNHQAAEASFLYRAGYPALAERLVAAIEATAEDWIRADGDLWYARTAEGTYFGTDYPYLTYNDLYELQLLLQGVRGERSAPIDRLMETKLHWMEAHGIEGYRN